MENTSCEGKCPFLKTGFCNSVEECPNHIESWWQEGQTGTPKLVRDCVPKRLMIQLAAMQARFEGVQLASEQARNECHRMNGHFAALLEESRRFIGEQEKSVPSLELKNKELT